MATPTPMPTADDDEVVVAAMMWMWRRMMDDKARSAHAKLVAAVRMMRRRPPRVVSATQARMVGCDGGSCSHSWLMVMVQRDFFGNIIRRWTDIFGGKELQIEMVSFDRFGGKICTHEY